VEFSLKYLKQGVQRTFGVPKPMLFIPQQALHMKKSIIGGGQGEH
jgi:hypothetical protein